MTIVYWTVFWRELNSQSVFLIWMIQGIAFLVSFGDGVFGQHGLAPTGAHYGHSSRAPSLSDKKLKASVLLSRGQLHTRSWSRKAGSWELWRLFCLFILKSLRSRSQRNWEASLPRTQLDDCVLLGAQSLPRFVLHKPHSCYHILGFLADTLGWRRSGFHPRSWELWEADWWRLRSESGRGMQRG